VGEARVQNPKADYRTYEVERWDEVCVRCPRLKPGSGAFVLVRAVRTTLIGLVARNVCMDKAHRYPLKHVNT